MIEVKIPAEIQDYKSKLIFGFSTRQVLSIAGAVVVGIIFGIWGRKYIPEDILPWLIILAVAPFAGYGFLKFKDMLFEEFARVYILFNFFPQKRVYEDTDVNIYLSFYEEILAEDIAEQRIANGERDPDNFEFEE